MNDLNFKAAVNMLQTKPLCSTPDAARLCRRFPWALRSTEGVVQAGPRALVVIDENLPEDSLYAKWQKRFPSEDRLKFLSYLIYGDEQFGKAAANSSFAVVYILMTRTTGKSQEIVSISMASRVQISRDTNQGFAQWKKELELTGGTWYPPEEFAAGKQFHQF